MINKWILSEECREWCLTQFQNPDPNSIAIITAIFFSSALFLLVYNLANAGRINKEKYSDEAIQKFLIKIVWFIWMISLAYFIYLKWG